MKYALWFEYDYNVLYSSLEFLSCGDQAALRSLRKKYDELRKDPHVEYRQAKAQLVQEYFDCLPVDA